MSKSTDVQPWDEDRDDDQARGGEPGRDRVAARPDRCRPGRPSGHSGVLARAFLGGVAEGGVGERVVEDVQGALVRPDLELEALTRLAVVQRDGHTIGRPSPRGAGCQGRRCDGGRARGWWWWRSCAVSLCDGGVCHEESRFDAFSPQGAHPSLTRGEPLYSGEASRTRSWALGRTDGARRSRRIGRPAAASGARPRYARGPRRAPRR